MWMCEFLVGLDKILKMKVWFCVAKIRRIWNLRELEGKSSILMTKKYRIMQI
jgi:hypothetical protein